MFIGNITDEETFYKLNTHLHVKFISVENGKVLWAADTADSGMHVGAMSSCTSDADTKDAVRRLKQDMGLQ